MAWDAYINIFLLEKHTQGEKTENCCAAAGIISKETGAIWSCSPNFSLKTYIMDIKSQKSSQTFKIKYNEAKEIINLLKNDPDLLNSGIRINKQKYQIVSHNRQAGSIYLRRPKGGACIAGTNLCIIIATFDENLQVLPSGQAPFFQNPGLCNERVEYLAEFLKSSGF
jgi:Profilin